MSTSKHNLNNKPVGFFDSGVGGLSVYSRFRQILPAENTLYYGDLAHLPYGSKSKEELVCFARNILNFFQKQDVKAVVIACNTSSAQVYDIIKNEYEFKIYPIIQSSAKVIANMKLNRIGVFATEATVKSGVYRRELQKYNSNLEVCEIACPNWVSFVENGSCESKEAVSDVSKKFEEMMSFSPDKIVLGCTHYPYLLNILNKLGSEELFLDPAGIFANYIKEDFETCKIKNFSSEKGLEKFYVSANPEAFVKNSKIFYEVPQTPMIPLAL